jgi:hypothetical protein
MENRGRIAGLGRSALLVAALAATAPAVAASRVTITAAGVEIAGQRLTDVDLRLDAAGTGTALRARVGGAALPPAAGPLREVELSCPRLRIDGDRVACADGELLGRFGILGAQRLRVEFEVDAGTSRVDARLENIAVAAGRVSARLAARGATLRAELDVADAAVEGLARLLPAGIAPPAGLALTGRLGARAVATLRDGAPVAVAAEISLAAGGYSTADGAQAAENLSATLRLRAAAGAGWSFDANGAITGGAVYSDPFYVDFGPHRLDASLRGSIDTQSAGLVVDAFTLEHAGIGRLSGSGAARPGDATPLQTLRIVLEDLDLAAAAPAYLRPALLTTDFKDIEALGHLRGGIDFAAGALRRVALTFDGVTLDSTTGALSVEGLRGQLHWAEEDLRRDPAPAADAPLRDSTLAFDDARLWGVEIGATTLAFTTSGRHFRLLEPVFLPIFDGGLAVQTLRVRHAGTPRMYVRFDADLQPISLARIATAAGLPPFAGTLAGSIPGLEIAAGVLTAKGNLEMDAFDGTIVVRDLRLRDPLGRYPQLFASIDIERLDLERLTSTFSFGMITGRISGRVEDLETFDWMPVALDARLYSTPGDKTKRRISQRAVANLSSIGGGSGGGVSAALQGGFLRFFRSFRYKRLGLSCVLRNDVCDMGGIEPAAHGYYIVKGAGLPRIDVIGSQRRVAWSRLVRQLAAITRSGGPVVR